MTTLRRFFSTKERKRIYDTLEIYHPSGVLLRYVTGRIDPLSVTLEASAPRNASESVEYIGGAFKFQRPEQQESVVQADIQLGRVGKQVKQILKSITGAARAEVGEIVYRQYIAGELTAPVFVLRLYITSITMNADGVAIRAEQDNPSDRRVAELYLPERFPGLAENL